MKLYFNNYLQLFALLMAAIALTSCEEVIDVDSPTGVIQLNVYGNVTDRPGTDTVKLSLTQPYFDSSTPPAVTDAVVILTDDAGYRDTLEHVGSGNYIIADGVGEVGRIYTLEVEHDGQRYKAVSQMYRTTVIDTIFSEDRLVEFGQPAGKYIFIGASDPAGDNDCYRFRYWVNGEYYNRAEDVTIAYDAAFSEGSDGIQFIYPIREAINFRRLEKNENKAFNAGDVVRVEIWSIGVEGFAFWNQLVTQVTNSGLFATPPANVVTNILNQDPNSDVKAVGWFGASSVVGAEVTVQ